MFCPNCGNQLPDGAAFCAKCGNQLRTNATPINTASASVGKKSSFTPLGILARICAVVAGIAMFMPWLEIPGMQSLGQYASLVGIKVNSDFAYPMYDMSDVTKTLDTLSSSSAYTTIQMLFFALWIVALVLLVVGLVRSFTGNKSSGALVPGGIVAALVSILWFAAITFLDGEYARQLAQYIGNRAQFFVIPAAVWVTFATGLASAILGAVGKNKA